MRLTPVVCPKCNESVPLSPEEGSCYCVYCGTHIMIGDNGNTFTYKSVDESRIKEAEIQERMQIRHHERERGILKVKVVISLFLGALAIIMSIVGEIIARIGEWDDATGYIGRNIEGIGDLLFLAIFLLWIADVVRQLTDRKWRKPTNQQRS